MANRPIVAVPTKMLVPVKKPRRTTRLDPLVYAPALIDATGYGGMGMGINPDAYTIADYMSAQGFVTTAPLELYEYDKAKSEQMGWVIPLINSKIFVPAGSVLEYDVANLSDEYNTDIIVTDASGTQLVVDWGNLQRYSTPIRSRRGLQSLKARGKVKMAKQWKRGDMMVDQQGVTFQVDAVTTTDTIATNVQDKSQWQIPNGEAATFTPAPRSRKKRSLPWDIGEGDLIKSPEGEIFEILAANGDSFDVRNTDNGSKWTFDKADLEGYSPTDMTWDEEQAAMNERSALRPAKRKTVRQFNPQQPIIQPQQGDEVNLLTTLPTYTEMGGQVDGQVLKGQRGTITHVVSVNGRAQDFWAVVGRGKIVRFARTDIGKRVAVKRSRRRV